MARTTWQNTPSTATPLSAAMLNDLEARKPEIEYQPINVRDYPGASLGAQLTNAIAAIPSTGATLFIPRGQYVGAFNIVGKDHLTIVGEGSSTVIHNTTSSDDALYLEDCDDLEVHGVRVQGTSGTRDGLNMVRCHRARIGNVFCGGTGRYGIRAEECLGLVVDPCYAGSALTPGPYPTGLPALDTCLVLTWDGVNTDSGCNGFTINGGFYISGQSQGWAITVERAELGVINSPVPELSGGGLYLKNCQHIDVNGYYGEANPSDIEYSTGTASFTNASTAVTGSGTAWATNDAQGHPNAWANKYVVRDTGTDVFWQRIQSAPTDTSITLAAGWPGPTEAGVAYRIVSFDLLMDGCVNCEIHVGRGGGAVALDNSDRNYIRATTDSLLIDAASELNDVYITTNRASGSATRVVDRGVTNYVQQWNWQTGAVVARGTRRADRFLAGSVAGTGTEGYATDASFQSVAPPSGYGFQVGGTGGTGNHARLRLTSGGELEMGAGGGTSPDVRIDRFNAGFARFGTVAAGAGGIVLRAFTVATRPAAASYTGAIIYVSDGGAGAVFQGSNGSAWVNLG